MALESRKLALEINRWGFIQHYVTCKVRAGRIGEIGSMMCSLLLRRSMELLVVKKRQSMIKLKTMMVMTMM